MRGRSQDKGMTLVELIIAFAISSVVILMVMTLLNTVLHGFTRTSDDVNLQMEAQTVLNQISNLAIQAVEIKPLEDEDSDGEESRYLIDGYGETDHVIVYAQNDHKLYLVTLSEGETAETTGYTVKENLLAEYVEGFEMMISDNSRYVDIKLQLKINGSEIHSVTKKIALRNAESKSDSE